jgi:hypothetical protein
MIRNYTSTVPATKSVNFIEDKLVRHGAKNIMKLYKDGKLEGIAFIITIDGRGDIPFRVPARIKKVEELFKNTVRRVTKNTYKNIREQAERTAWKLIADWVDVQMSLIDLQQVELMEVFLPYAYDPIKEQTYFEKVKESQFKMLTEGEG